MAIAPAKTEISDTYPNPSNAVARAGFASLYDWVLDALGSNSSAAPVTVASSATVDLSAVTTTRNIIISGTTQITAFTVPIGRVFIAKASGALPIANNGSIVLQGGANITLKANDSFLIRATASNTVEVLLIGGVQTFNSNTYTAAQRGYESSLPATTGSVTLDLLTSNNFGGTTSGNITLSNPSNISSCVGQSGVIRIVNGSGSHTVAYGSYWKPSDGVTLPSLTALSGANDCLIYYVESSTRILVGKTGGST